MRQTSILSILLVLVIAGACTDQTADDVPEAADQTAQEAQIDTDPTVDNTFYALGFALSRNLEQFHLTEAELEQVKRGLADGVKGEEPKIDLEAASQRIQELAQERSRQAAEGERAAGETFLAEAAAVSGAEKTESGLIFQSIEKGDGPSPGPSDVVSIHYRGTLRDGTVFDSSYERGQPVRFPLDQVIPCWSEGIQKMNVGGKAKLICPPDLAYGDRSSGPIPPGSTLIFETELLEIVAGNPES